MNPASRQGGSQGAGHGPEHYRYRLSLNQASIRIHSLQEGTVRGGGGVPNIHKQASIADTHPKAKLKKVN